jgi:hypothetical protein
MKFIFGPSLFALCLMATSANAAAIVPKVAGTYGITVSTDCAALLEGKGRGAGKMTFPTTAASTSHVSMSFQWFDWTAKGEIIQSLRSISGKLELTATTFTITPKIGQGPSGSMSFGEIDTNGVAHTLNFLWTDFDDGFGLWCVHTINATQQ